MKGLLTILAIGGLIWWLTRSQPAQAATDDYYIEEREKTPIGPGGESPIPYVPPEPVYIPPVYVPLVWTLGDSYNVKANAPLNPENIGINQPPDGNYAILSGGSNLNFISFKTDEPVLVKEVIVHIVNPYSYEVENFLSLRTSENNLQAHECGALDVPGRYWMGPGTATIEVNTMARYIYLYQRVAGVAMGIDAIEIETE